MQDRRTRAQAAVKLLEAAIVEDDQDVTDFLSSIVESEQLYLECSDDAGKPITSMADFAAAIEAESTGASPTASHKPGRMTPAERYRARQAAMGR